MGKTEVLFEEVMSADHNNAKANIVVKLNGEKHVFADVEYFELFIEKNKNEVITLGKTSFPFVLGAVEAAIQMVARAAHAFDAAEAKEVKKNDTTANA